MELTEGEQVLVELPREWEEKPTWFSNFVTNIEWDQTLTLMKSNKVTKEWFLTKYDATFEWDSSRRCWTLVFPNRETYLQCLLTWS